MRTEGLGLTLLASAPHLVATVVTLAYNGLVQRAFAEEMAGRGGMLSVAALYGAAAVTFGAFVGLVLAHRLRTVLADSARDPSGAFLMYLVFRALSGTCTWLLSIPVLAAVATVTYGRVHPIGFPHFCASVVVGWLLSTTYSMLLCIRRFADELPEGRYAEKSRATLAAAARVLPLAAAGVPLVAGSMFLFFVSPMIEPSAAYRALMGLLVAIMTLGGYGFVYCSRLIDRIAVTRPVGSG